MQNATDRSSVDGDQVKAQWAEAPIGLELKPNEVHLWLASLEPGEENLGTLASWLAPDERERAQRFHFPKDQNHFIAARGWLRVILGRYARCSPGRLIFSYSAYGKPQLGDGPWDPHLRFNLAHAHGLALYGITLNCEIGVDLERIQPEIASDSIAERFFAPAEIKALRSFPAAAQIEAFFHCWARKEAFIKAHGRGLLLPLNQFVVSLGPIETAALLETAFDPPAATRWQLRGVAAPPGYTAAFVVQGSIELVKRWRCTPALLARIDRV